MRHLLFPLLTAILCATTSAQTMKALMYSTNGSVVAPAIAFTNQVSVLGVNIAPGGMLQYNGNDIYDMSVNSFVGIVDFTYPSETRANLGFSANISALWTATNASNARTALGFSTNLSTLWTSTNSSNARSAVGLGATWLTNTNVTDFRTAVGLGVTNSPQFTGITVGAPESDDIAISATGITTGFGGISLDPQQLNNNWAVSGAFSWTSNSYAAATRSNLSLGLPALTNTSNVTAMRALSGSTNTNHPYSGSISVTGTNNTNTLVFSNGILQSVQ